MDRYRGENTHFASHRHVGRRDRLRHDLRPADVDDGCGRAIGDRMIAIKGGVWGRENDPDAETPSHIAAVTERMKDFAAPEMHRKVGRQVTLAAHARRHGGGAARVLAEPPARAVDNHDPAWSVAHAGSRRSSWSVGGDTPGAARSQDDGIDLVLTQERLPILETRRSMDALAAFEHWCAASSSIASCG
jgi:hypothetical protein